jgi:nucleotide-binding universal stress UspA family protein
MVRFGENDKNGRSQHPNGQVDNHSGIRMMIKNILAVPMNSPMRDSMMASALHVARKTGAHISAVFVKGPPELPEQFGILPDSAREELLHQFRTERDRKVEEAHSNYADFVQREGLPEQETPRLSDDASISWEIAEGQTPNVVARRGGAYDLIVIGRPASDTEHADILTVESALFTTGRPVLISPPEPPKTLGETVLIGWNRSAQSARAFHVAKALLLDRAKKVRILSVTTGAKNGPSAEQIADNLAWHGIEAEIREFSPDHSSIGAVLLAEASAIDADLIVMGAYTHSRLRQILLGGVTKHVLANATVPLFMAR